jgi:membrane protein
MLLEILKELWQRIRVNDTLDRSYTVAFHLTLAIFPATIFIFTLIPYISIPDLVPKFIGFLKEMVPPTVYEALAPTIQDTLGKQRSGLLSFGVIYSLYLASNGMMSLLKSFDLVDSTSSIKHTRTYLQQRGIATLLTLALTAALFSSLLLLIVTRQVLDYMFSQGIITSKLHIIVFSLGRPIIIFLIFFITISGIYYLAPTNKQHAKFIFIGALVATVASFLASVVFSYYVTHFAKYNLYGSLGIMIALMLWLFSLSFILLVGFELNITLKKMFTTSHTG